MPLQALGYAGFGSSSLDDWRQFGTGLVGLQAVERSPSLLAFRMRAGSGHGRQLQADAGHVSVVGWGRQAWLTIYVVPAKRRDP